MKKWQFWLGVLISVFFVWISLRGLRLDEFWGAVKQANYMVDFARYRGVFCRRMGAGLAMALPAEPDQKNFPRKPCSPSPPLATWATISIPARAGEVLRAVILKDREGVPISASLATIIVERIFDGVVMLAFVFFNLSELAKLTGNSGFIGNIQQLAV